MTKFACLLAFLIILSGCSDDSYETNREMASYFHVGMFDAVLDLSEENSKYRGMLYEYGLVGPVNISLAKEIYKEVDDDIESNKRLFLICFLYCEEEIDKYYRRSKEDNLVTSIYSIFLLAKNGECKSKIKSEICKIQTDYYRSTESKDYFFNIGIETYRLMYKERRRKEEFQYPYYLLMKSYINGNQAAKKFLDITPDRFSWIPKPKKES